MTIQQTVTKILNTMIIAGLCITPEMMPAQQSQNSAPQNQSSAQQNQSSAQQNQSPAQQNQNSAPVQNQAQQPQTPAQPPANTAQPAQAPQNGAQASQEEQPAVPQGGIKVDPSQAPLQPVTTYPDASQQQQNEPEPQNAQQPQTTVTEQVPEAPQPKKPSEPVGTAAAEKVPTAGGAASKPAGIAIAPAKQHQMRGLLIKIGAIAAAGVAVGTIYGLSRGTPSIPPNTSTPGATQK